MNDQTLQALTALAMRLGTTVEHLWGVLVAQVPVNAGLACAWAGALAGLFAAIYRPCVAEYRRMKELDEYDPPPFPLFPLVVVGVLALFASFYALNRVVTAVFNPEYRALQLLQDLLR